MESKHYLRRGPFKQLQKIWIKWINELQDMTQITITRQYIKETVNNIHLHVFCDSSQLAYGAVAYMRCNTTFETKCAFVMSKSKVAFVKQQTLPRLELLGTLLGAQLSNYLSRTILHNIKSLQTTLWNDSKVVLSWITNPKQSRQQFIRHRVQLIKDYTSQATWRYCPSTLNPADLVTRGLDCKSFMHKEKEWF